MTNNTTNKLAPASINYWADITKSLGNVSEKIGVTKKPIKIAAPTKEGQSFTWAWETLQSNLERATAEVRDFNVDEETWGFFGKWNLDSSFLPTNFVQKKGTIDMRELDKPTQFDPSTLSMRNKELDAIQSLNAQRQLKDSIVSMRNTWKVDESLRKVVWDTKFNSINSDFLIAFLISWHGWF